MSVHPSNLSPLYIACRQNDVNSVRLILTNLSIEEINRIESNGSTALHVAAYNGHGQIVRLLLDKGASIAIKNKFGLRPIQEARTDEVRLLLEKRGIHDEQSRFVGEANAIEWLVVNERAAECAPFYRAALKEAYDTGVDRELLLLYAKAITAKDRQGRIDVINCMSSFFRSNDAKEVVKAYTAQSSFYKILNQELAKMINHRDEIKTVVNLEGKPAGAIAALLSFDPTLQEFSFVGDTYRGMRILRDDLDQYKQGSVIMTKSFLSSSTNRLVADGFSQMETKREEPNVQMIKFPVICQYTIRNARTALAVETISIYPKEKEVIILPINVFKVVSVKKIKGQFEIKLIEQDRLVPLLTDDATMGTGIWGMMCYFAYPCCYRKCCMKCCGVVEHPDS